MASASKEAQRANDVLSPANLAPPDQYLGHSCFQIDSDTRTSRFQVVFLRWRHVYIYTKNKSKLDPNHVRVAAASTESRRTCQRDTSYENKIPAEKVLPFQDNLQQNPPRTTIANARHSNRAKAEVQILLKAFRIMGRRPETGAEPRLSKRSNPIHSKTNPSSSGAKPGTCISLPPIPQLYHPQGTYSTTISTTNSGTPSGSQRRVYTCTGTTRCETGYMRGGEHPHILSVPRSSLSILTRRPARQGIGVLQVDRPQRLAGVMYGTDEHGEPVLEAVQEALKRGGLPGGIPGRKGI